MIPSAGIYRERQCYRIVRITGRGHSRRLHHCPHLPVFTDRFGRDCCPNCSPAAEVYQALAGLCAFITWALRKETP